MQVLGECDSMHEKRSSATVSHSDDKKLFDGEVRKLYDSVAFPQ